MVRPGRAVDGEKRSQERGAPPLSRRSGAPARREQEEDVGRFCQPSYVESEIPRKRPVSACREATLTGPASPRRSVCAPGCLLRHSIADRFLEERNHVVQPILSGLAQAISKQPPHKGTSITTAACARDWSNSKTAR